MPKRIKIDGKSLTIGEINAVARLGARVSLASSARKAMKKNRSFLERLVAKGMPIYGVTTGTGDLAREAIPPELGTELQKRLVLSHAAGIGDIKPVETVRAAMLCRANTLAKGLSGVRVELVEMLLDMLNSGVTPVVHEKGSVGASGDLSPLCQVAMVAMGSGEAWYRGERIPGAFALKKAGLEPLDLGLKEGVGLINGSQMMTGEASLLWIESENIVKNALIASAMTVEALRAAPQAFDARIHEARPFGGQISVAANMRRLLEGSKNLSDPADKVQSAYSLRCIPQILGPSVDALYYVEKQISIEINSAADNPLFFDSDGEHLAGGNFHGQPIAMAADFLSIALCETGSLAERHINRLLNAKLSGLPPYLTEKAGLNSGLMAAQLTAASLASENKALSHPGVVDSISVLADEEDHVSMGPVSIRKLREILKNTAGIVAIEMLCAAQAIDLRGKKKAGQAVRAAHRTLRSAIPRLTQDRPLYPDIEKAVSLLESGDVTKSVERKIGPIDLKKSL